MKADQLMYAEELASRPYLIQLQTYTTPAGQTYFFGRVRELPGCVSDGDTKQEAEANVRSAMIDYIYFLLEDGLAVPAPKDFPGFTTIDMSNIEDVSTHQGPTPYRSLPLDSSHRGQGATASPIERRVYVA